MKQFCCALVLALAPMTSVTLAQDYQAARPQADLRPYIYIEADATIKAAADLTKIAISFSEKRKSPQEATELVSSKIAEFNAALAVLGVPSSSIETRSFDFSKVYIIATDKKGVPVSSYSDPDRDKFDGFRATYNAVVTLNTTDRIGEVLNSASVLGIEVTSVSFASSKDNEYREQVRKLAADKARARAELYAASLGGTLGNLLNVKEGTGYNPDTMDYYQPDGEADLGVMVEMDSTAIAPGKLTFSSSISAKWELASGN